MALGDRDQPRADERLEDERGGEVGRAALRARDGGGCGQGDLAETSGEDSPGPGIAPAWRSARRSLPGRVVASGQLAVAPRRVAERRIARAASTSPEAASRPNRSVANGGRRRRDGQKQGPTSSASAGHGRERGLDQPGRTRGTRHRLREDPLDLERGRGGRADRHHPGRGRAASGPARRRCRGRRAPSGGSRTRSRPEAPRGSPRAARARSPSARSGRRQPGTPPPPARRARLRARGGPPRRRGAGSRRRARTSPRSPPRARLRSRRGRPPRRSGRGSGRPSRCARRPRRCAPSRASRSSPPAAPPRRTPAPPTGWRRAPTRTAARPRPRSAAGADPRAGAARAAAARSPPRPRPRAGTRAPRTARAAG